MIPFIVEYLSNHPLTSRDERDDLADESAADKCENGDGGDGKADGDERIGLITIHEVGCNGGKEEQMHEVHAKGELGESGDKTWSLLLFDAGEEQEGTERGKQHIGRAEFP